MDPEAPKRYVSALRQTQVALTQQNILRAMSASLQADSITGDTPAAIAQLANISERTLYRHFPTREIRWAAFLDWVSELVGVEKVPETERDLLTLVPVLFARFDECSDLMELCLKHRPWSGVWIAGRKECQDFATNIMARYRDSDPVRAAGCEAFVLFTLSGISWKEFRDHGIAGAPAAEEAVRVISMLFDDLRQQLPGP